MEINNENLHDKKLLELRTNIIRWYDFDKNANVLVIGDNTGKITEFLSNKVKNIVVIGKNGLIDVALKYPNVEVINKNVEDLKVTEIQKPFDYIIMIDQLSFKHKENKNINILEKAKELLCLNGKILLVVNNCLSLKFLSEIDADHYDDIKGMSKFSLEKTLMMAGLNSYKFYYPLPNTENTNVIFTDKLLPTSIELERSIDLKKIIEAKNFDDRRLLAEIAENNKYDFKYYCNTFLVEIGDEKSFAQVNAIYYNNIRKDKYRLITKILDQEVHKYAMNNESNEHIKRIAKNIDVLKECNINTLDRYENGKIISQYIINPLTLQKMMLDEYRQCGLKGFLELVDVYIKDILLKLQKNDSTENNVFDRYGINVESDKLNQMTFLKNGLFDLVASNIFYINNQFYVYDQEWYEENVPLEFFVYRTIMYFPQIFNHEKQEIFDKLNISIFIPEFQELENKLQFNILDKDLHLNCLNNYKSYDLIQSKCDSKKLKIQLDEKVQETEKYKSEIEEYKKELVFKQGLIDSKELMNGKINNELSNFSTAYFTVRKELQKLQEQYNEKNQEVNMLYNSEQYQKGILAIQREQKMYPITSKVNVVKNGVKKVFRPIKKGLVKVLRKIGRIVYENYPIKEHKRKLKNKFLYSDKLAKIGSVTTYKDYCAEAMDVMLFEDGHQERCIKYQVGLDKTIGIHLHLFYEDLLDEFYTYFCNIPYVFDLYVSVMEGANIKQITKKFNQILNLNELKVKVVPNSGRDFGPMFVAFGDDLKRHDYIMHVHTKKSLRMGNEQSEWRKYMLDNLLGSTSRIMKCFYLLEQMNMGMVYVDSFRGPCPYWINTWLGEKPLAREILNKIGMECEDEILQFPAGSMFWAKTDAIHQLFDLNLIWDDFGYEEDENKENNLPYVFERITGKVARHNGYDLAIYNVEEGQFRKNFGNQQLSDYYNLNKDIMVNSLMEHDIISFDIFDTLITRNIYKPDDIFEIIANKISEKVKIDHYFELRKQAENNARMQKNGQGDCNIHEIYDEFQKLTNLSKEDTNFIKETEIQTECDLIIPRKDMLYVYNRLLEHNKKIVLVSDMYLTKDIITKMLNKCGYYNWYEILVSSEVGYRKDNETMWTYFFDKYKNCSTVHVGDNEYSDIHAVVKRGKPQCHIYKGTKLNTLMKQKYAETDDEFNLMESVVIGSLINKVVCNSPFVMNSINTESIIHNYYDFGYAVLGPIIFKYMQWIVNQAKKEKKGEVLLFSAREGYYLQKIYHLFKEKIGGLDKVEDHYLYISRRAVTVMGIETLEDAREIMEMYYNGAMREVLYYRLNYKGNDFKDEIISLPRDVDKVMAVVERNWNEILANAKKEKEGYLKYIDSLKIDFENKRVSVLDLGYAGTAQYYLAKLLNKKISGKYFVVESKLKPIKLGCEVFSCFNKNIYSKAIDKNILFKNSLFLESFLTAPDGQFVCMNIEGEELKPQFLYERNKEEQMKKLDVVYEGVKDFIELVLNLFGEKALEYEIDNKYIYRTYEMCLKESYKFDEKMRELFLIEDYYTSNAVLNGFDLYNQRKKEWNYE